MTLKSPTLETTPTSQTARPDGAATRPPRLLLVAQSYFPMMGGIETHVRQVATEFTRRGGEVTIAAMNFAQPRTKPSLHVLHTDLLAPPFENYRDGDVPVLSMAPTSRVERVRLLPIGLRATPRLRRVAYDPLLRFGYGWYRRVIVPKLREQAKNVDLVHALAGSYIGWAAQEAARLEGVPFVCTPFVHPKQWGDAPDDVRYYQRSDAVIGLVNTDRDYLVSIGVPKEKAHTIGVSPDLPAQVDGAGFRQRHGFTAETPLVLFVGRMTAHKGAASIMAAVEKVWKAAPETHFLFIGPATHESTDWFPKEGGDPRIHYLGRVDTQEKGDALAACDIFCMPSMSEILPTVYLEAWSLGKPVVGGMAHGLPELVEGNGGGLNVAQDGEKVADALIGLLLDPTRRRALGDRGQALVAQKYSVAGVTDQLDSLYRTLIAARKNG